jgi:putative RNA 2'-phosphotransferase|tara:strand:- start:91 stop:615 length:525 start_codon:yes stop_codon:yes gene_type:complete
MSIKNQSKFLSLILRHKPETINLTLDEQGWADVGAILYGCTLSMDVLEEIVEKNNKKRFEFNTDKSKIRASQGHSVKINLDYKAQKPPDTLFHGTIKRNWENIQNSGLKKMNRHHVHLSVDEKTAIEVGKRRGKPIVISIDSGRMHSNGFMFFLSTNGVWLTDNVPIKYITIKN